MHFVLFYELAENYLEKRGRFREEHLELARKSADRGELILGGSLDPADTALLLFKDQSSAEVFAERDPYISNGLVKSWQVRKWDTVVGGTIES